VIPIELQPGEYRYAMLAELCGVSRTTAEKFKERYGLTETMIPYNGREVKGVVLTAENCRQIQEDLTGVQQGVVQPLQQIVPGVAQGGAQPYAQSFQRVAEPLAPGGSLLENRFLELSERVLALSEELIETKTELAQKSSELIILNREMESRNTALKRYKDDEEERRRLERENAELRAQIRALTQPASPSDVSAPESKNEELEAIKVTLQRLLDEKTAPQPAKSWWQKILGG
jgi:hypothetical protein